MIDYEEELQVSDASLHEIAQLAKKLVYEKNALEILERDVKLTKDRIRKLEEDLLPTAMAEVGGVGMDQFTLSNGAKLCRKRALHMSIPKRNMPSVCDWAVQHGHGSLVRTSIEASFGAGELERAEGAQHALDAQGVPYSVATSVNTGSLKALVKELLEHGEDVPLKLMGGYEREYVEITMG